MPIARKRMLAAGFIAISLGYALLHAAFARTVGEPGNKQPPLEMQSHLGSYLAGRLARGLNDTSNAVEFYRHALEFAPREPRIIERTFLMEALEGRIAAADERARQVITIRPDNRLARLWLGAAEFRAGRYNSADAHFARASEDPISELTSELARAWIALARKKRNEAFERLVPDQPRTWSAYYIQYHRALIFDLSGQTQKARQAYREIFKADTRTPRTTAAYIRHAINRGMYSLAGRTARRHIQTSADGGHASITALFKEIKAGRRTELIVQTPREGIAEVFYGLGEALISEGGVDLGTIYLQIALALKPDFPFALAALANAYETMEDNERAIAVYDRIRDGTPLEMDVQIRKAINFNALNETDHAKKILDDTVASYPRNTRPLEAMGNILRSRKRYREAIDYYSKLLKLLPKSEKRHWTYWYARGTSYERIKQWPKAEKDLLKAMELDQDQALILNYLGYSWVDQNIHLQRGLELIEKAVRLKPDDGYIVDSLGWAHYRLGNFDEAVMYLERAVELRPEDPILNDHLGDALWQVNRKREARYQWELSLTLNPEEEDAARIRKKLTSGLPPRSDLKAVNKKTDREISPASIGKRADNNNTGKVSPIR